MNKPHAKIPGGYILQPRAVDRSGIMKCPPVVRELWLYLLRNVNHKTNGIAKRGQGFFRLEDIQKDLSWHVGYRLEKYSKPQLTKSLRRLREGLMIETTKETRGVLVTVLNYDYYQSSENYEGNDEGSAKETRRKSSGRTINKNDKECKNEKKDPPTPQRGAACPYQKIIETYHSTCPGLPRVQAITPTLEKRVSARWKASKDRQDLGWWQEYFKAVAASDFLMGRVKSWTANFHWLTGPENMDKVLNGAYRPTTGHTPPTVPEPPPRRCGECKNITSAHCKTRKKGQPIGACPLFEEL